MGFQVQSKCRCPYQKQSQPWEGSAPLHTAGTGLVPAPLPSSDLSSGEKGGQGQRLSHLKLSPGN